MGKYMKKSKIAGDFAVMDVSPHHHCSLGVRTRAKTLALQRLQSADVPDAASFAYLQLRSRRLEKLPPPIPAGNRNYEQQQPSRSVIGESCGRSVNNNNPKAAGSRLGESGSVGSVSIGDNGGEVKNGTEDLGIEASLGENNLDFEGRERGTRESTPCSFVRDPNTIGTPGSTTRQSGSTGSNRRLRNDVQRDIPTSREMEEFFACAEKQQQRLFMDKYNFDVVNDLPLPGRYDWLQLTP